MKLAEPIPEEMEKEIVRMLADGMKAPNVANKVRLPETRLAAVLSDLRTKYDCLNSTHLVAYFLRNKLID